MSNMSEYNRLSDEYSSLIKKRAAKWSERYNTLRPLGDDYASEGADRYVKYYDEQLKKIDDRLSRLRT